jgi:dTDP-4-amino-4,6-dideoxygalactose transaminase
LIFRFLKKGNPAPPRRLFGEEELRAVREVFRHSWKTRVDFGYQGEFERRYTDAFTAYQGGGYADAVATGTAAVFVAVAALELPAGSHVLCSPITDPGTVSAIILNGHKVVIMDSMPGSYNSGPDQFMAAITPETRAVVLVHAAGKAAPVDRIVALARARGIRVVEDCSQAHGASLGGKKVGTFGDIAAFSTMYRKAHATGGCGGVVYTRDRSLYWKGRSYADRGKPFGKEPFDEKDVRFFRFPALNLNLDEVSCAIGEVTLRKLDETRRRRMNFANRFGMELAKMAPDLRAETFTEEDSPFFLTVHVRPGGKFTVSQAAEFLQSKGYSVNPCYRYLLAEWPWLKKFLVNSSCCSETNACFCSGNAKGMRDQSCNILFNERNKLYLS